MTQRFPFPAFPTGWFAVAFSDEVPPGRVERRTFMGEEVVVFRTDSGRPAVLGAYCPHMGAHLGYGGRVVGERIRCPMHRFELDTDAVCVATGYGTKPPPTCRGKARRVCEVHGAIFAWHDASGREPSFELPDVGYDGWTSPRTHCFAGLPSHPQETTENSVDIGHFAAVHGYEKVSVRAPLEIDGAHLTIGYRFERAPLFRGAPTAGTEIEIHVHGLGFSFVDVHLPDYGLRTRNLVLPTPIDGEHIDLRIALRLRGAGPVMGALPAWALDRLLGSVAIRTYVNDVTQDYDIWANKRYVHPPALAEGDGPIGKYRRWAQQFYPASKSAAAE